MVGYSGIIVKLRWLLFVWLDVNWMLLVDIGSIEMNQWK